MIENLRLLFSFLWIASVGGTLASALAVLVSWGDHLEYFIAAIIALAVSTVGAIVTSI
ncbi:MAG TPA: hypothetical protein VNM40_02045 [Candidatus Paceibacterota bacterium]|nr:hypothetical protein [Candidatus Paceibacterota bacterium]